VAIPRSKPAILGGEPLLREPLPESNTIGPDELEAVRDVLASGVLSGFSGTASVEFYGGPAVRRLEAAFCERFGVRVALSMNSATSALEAALTALEVGWGDEVILPPFTMSATASAVLRVNAIPVFADIEETTFNLSPDRVREAITDRTRAILAVNLFGQPAALDELREIADQHDLRLIEDNSQSPGATWNGRFAGTIGDAGVFSLNQHKIVHCGEGGVLVTDNERVAERAALVRNHGEVVLDQLMERDPRRPYEALIGNNFRLAEPLAAVAEQQLKKLDRLTAHRVELAQRLTERLGAFDCLTPPVVRPEATHVYFAYPIRFDSARAGLRRERFAAAMAAENLPVGEGYVKPIYRYPIFREQPNKCAGPFHDARPHYPDGLCPVAERMYDEELILTTVCRTPLSGAHVELFVRAVERILEHAHGIEQAEERVVEAAR
jgi:dTDP-4-amino-4,6-dideoxygalactose transaminase